MKITNKHNLPQPLVDRIRQHLVPPKPDEIRVSALIEPPLIRKLLIEKWDEIEADATDFIWAALGTSFHESIAAEYVDNGLVEETFSAEVDGVRITGRPDLYLDDAIYDYKTTTINTLKRQNRVDKWAEQLNVYAYLLRKTGFTVKKLYILAVLRDWTPYHSEEYPTQIVCLKIPVWGEDELADFVHYHINKHRRCLPCTPEDRWRKPERYGCRKKKRKTWLWYPDEQSMRQAAAFLGNPDEVETNYKPPFDTRCAYYCPVRNVCPYKVAEYTVDKTENLDIIENGKE